MPPSAAHDGVGTDRHGDHEEREVNALRQIEKVAEGREERDRNRQGEAMHNA